MTTLRLARAMTGIWFALGAFAGVPSTATAQDATRGVVTVLDLKACKILKRHADGNSWLCKGLTGNSVYVAEGDLRFFVSAGATPQKYRAAQQTLPPFNTLFRGQASRASIEWRVKGQGKVPQPYATIVRFYTQRDEARGEVLVVSKVSPTESCQMVAIDALATANAMELARKLADERAEKFSCKDDPKTEGQSGKSPM